MAPGKACHNCRRRRLRCDRSIPECNKCRIAGQQCLGYGQLLRWTAPLAVQHPTPTQKHSAPTCQKVVASCNGFCSAKTTNRRCDGYACAKLRSNTQLRIAQTLVDPLFQDLDGSCRHYLNYFTERFCPDLVVHDDGHHMSNPFRQLVAMSGIHVSLRHIITATSAMHFRMATRHGSVPGQEIVSANALVDALRARQLAIQSLSEILERQKLSGNDNTCFGRGEKDALFATIVFFINFTLLDSEQSEWRAHMEAAGNFILDQASNSTNEEQESSYLTPAEWLPISAADSQESGTPSTRMIDTPCQDKYDNSFDDSSLSRQDHQRNARDYIASDFVSYYIWTCALEALVSGASSKLAGHRSIATSLHIEPATALPILLRTEHNTYHSCPAHLFHMILRVSHIARALALNREDSGSTAAQLKEVSSILHEAQYFDIDEWAARVCTLNAAATPVMRGKNFPLEVERRRHIAATYRATTCLFILLAIPGIQEFIVSSSPRQEEQDKALTFLPTTTDLAATILSQLSHIPPSSPLFKYTTWPIFMAGVETRQPAQRAWAMGRLQAMWELCPWGMLQSAMMTLGDIWGLRDSAASRTMKGINTLMMKKEDGGEEGLVDDKAAGKHFEGYAYDGNNGSDDYDENDEDDGAKWMARLRDLDLKIDYMII